MVRERLGAPVSSNAFDKHVDLVCCRIWNHF